MTMTTTNHATHATLADCERHLEDVYPGHAQARDGEVWTCSCKRRFVHACDEAEGCSWSVLSDSGAPLGPSTTPDDAAPGSVSGSAPDSAQDRRVHAREQVGDDVAPVAAPRPMAVEIAWAPPARPQTPTVQLTSEEDVRLILEEVASLRRGRDAGRTTPGRSARGSVERRRDVACALESALLALSGARSLLAFEREALSRHARLQGLAFGTVRRPEIAEAIARLLASLPPAGVRACGCALDVQDALEIRGALPPWTSLVASIRALRRRRPDRDGAEAQLARCERALADLASHLASHLLGTTAGITRATAIAAPAPGEPGDPQEGGHGRPDPGWPERVVREALSQLTRPKKSEPKKSEPKKSEPKKPKPKKPKSGATKATKARRRRSA
jgi:hypothetical protein